MAQNVVESIFNSKKNLSDFYPQFPNIRTFDLEKKHLFYGRINKDGDTVYLDDSKLNQLPSGPGGPHLAIDFVSHAFSDMRTNIRSAANKGYISGESLYPVNLSAFKSWSHGDLEFNYNKYIDKLYTTFVNSYLTFDNRANSIKSYSDFIKQFMRFLLRTLKYFPVTKTGYISSVHCSPFISGLMIDIAAENYGLHNNARVLEYVSDPNFSFFVNEAKKFGFMVDKNAPWRIVFNLASGLQGLAEDKLVGAQKYMRAQAVEYENVFDIYYKKSFLEDVTNLRKQFFTLYNTFYLQFSTYEDVKYITCQKGARMSKASFSTADQVVGRLVSERKERQPPVYMVTEQTFPTGNQELAERREIEYWLKILLRLRLVETDTEHTEANFNFYANELIRIYRLFDEKQALTYINKLTKGFNVINFLSKGSYWHGISDHEYEKEKIKMVNDVNLPSNVDSFLTGTKNLK